jgi:hypothetical protein
MALIKQKRANHTGAAEYNISRHGSIAVISPNQDYIWVGDDALDYDSLSPVFHKECVSLDGRRNIQKIVNGGLLVTGPCAWTPQENDYYQGYTTGDVDNGNVTAYNYKNLKNYRNMDKQERADCGTLLSFNDTNGNPHYLINHYVGSGSKGRTIGMFTFIEGSDFTNPSNVQNSGKIQLNRSSPISAQTYDWGDVVHIDTTNKFIFLNCHSSNNTYPQRGTHTLAKVPFTTSSVDGSHNIDYANTSNIDLNTELGNSVAFDCTSMNYCGKNNAGEHCFLTVLESDDLASSSGAVLISEYATHKDDRHRLMFVKYNPVTQTATTLADLKGTQGFVGDVNQATTVGHGIHPRHFPTHFEQSPIGGEGDIYYAYDVCVEHATEIITVLLYKWDKANDNFFTSICTIDFGGNGVITDYIKRVYFTNGANFGTSNVNPAFQLSATTCVLTNDGQGNYFLSLFTLLTTPTVASLCTEPYFNTLLTLSIDSTDFTDLTYHSHSSFSPLSAVTANTNCTQMYAIETGRAMVMNWTNTGWSVTVEESGIFHAIGRDQDNRIWATKVSSPDVDALPLDTAMTSRTASTTRVFDYSLHFLSANLPSSATVEFEDSEITYAGVDLSKNVLVNAFDENNARVVKTVQLKLSGSNAVFASNGAKTLSVQTSAGANTIVGLTITGAGFINISASFTI